MNNTPEYPNALRERFNKYLVNVELIGLAGIALATCGAMLCEAKTMVTTMHVTLQDLLLMFLYLEVLAMVQHYFRAGQLPVRFPLYIAMTAIARELILGSGAITDNHMIASAVAVLLLAIGVLVTRLGQVKFPTSDD